MQSVATINDIALDSMTVSFCETSRKRREAFERTSNNTFDPVTGSIDQSLTYCSQNDNFPLIQFSSGPRITSFDWTT
jgi:hypothetical protein